MTVTSSRRETPGTPAPRERDGGRRLRRLVYLKLHRGWEPAATAGRRRPAGERRRGGAPRAWHDLRCRPQHHLVRALLRLLTATGQVGVAGHEHRGDVLADVRLVDRDRDVSLAPGGR